MTTNELLNGYHQLQVEGLNELATVVASELYDQLQLSVKVQADLDKLQLEVIKLRAEIETCPGTTKFQQEWLGRAKRRLEDRLEEAGPAENRLKSLARRNSWLEYRLEGIKLQRDWHHSKLKPVKPPGQPALSAMIPFIGPDRPHSNGGGGHIKNPHQVNRSREDLAARGKLSSNGQQNGQASKPKNAKGKKARKAAAQQAQVTR